VADLEEDFPLAELDPERPTIISAWGRKGSGKSTFNRRTFRSFPGDRLAIDVNGNADPGPDAEDVPTPIPTRYPEPAPGLGERRRARNFYFRAHPGSATYRDDLDRVVGMALYPQRHRTCLWAGEVGELTPHGRSGPHMRTLLMQNRHYNVTALFDGPRPAHVDPLIYGQSDLIAVYHLPNPDDRDKLAKGMGYPAARFHRECEETFRRGKYWFLLWHAEEHQLWRMAPLPADDETTEAAT
jgi:hypothetical protein